MSRAVDSKILVVSPADSDLCATLSGSLKSCGLSPEVVSEEAPLEERAEGYACLIYIGSDYEVRRERA